jgi:hypothetical protein
MPSALQIRGRSSLLWGALSLTLLRGKTSRTIDSVKRVIELNPSGESAEEARLLLDKFPVQLRKTRP